MRIIHGFFAAALASLPGLALSSPAGAAQIWTAQGTYLAATTSARAAESIYFQAGLALDGKSAIEFPAFGQMHRAEPFVHEPTPGGWRWSGFADGDESSSVILVMHGGRLAGRIRIGAQVFAIQPGEPLRPDESRSMEQPSPRKHVEPLRSGSPDAIDVLITYVPEAVAEAGGAENIAPIVDSMIFLANEVMRKSNASARFNLVGLLQSPIHHNSNSTFLLESLRQDPWTLEQRDLYQADLVTLLVAQDFDVCGRAYFMSEPTFAWEPFGYQVTGISCANQSIAWAHESGHNLGMNHEMENSGPLLLYPWAHGWQVSGVFRTVMSYGSTCSPYCPPVEHYSNPEVEYQDHATGVDGLADNARIAEDNYRVVMAYRGLEELPRRICRVDWRAPERGDGQSWATAFNDLREALRPGACAEIWIAGGTYHPVTPADPGEIVPYELTKRFLISSGMQLYGGFAGTESSRMERRPDLHATIISGDLLGDDTPDFGNRGDNSHRLLVALTSRIHPMTPDTRVDGLIIEGSHYDSLDGTGFSCYGEDPEAECSPTLHNLIFRNNYSQRGGAIAFSSFNGARSNPVLSSIQFSGNKARVGGGAVFLQAGDDGSTVQLLGENLTFSSNSSWYGGSMRTDAADGSVLDATITGSTFHDNDSEYGSAGIEATTSGDFSETRISLANTTFYQNTSGSMGAALFTESTTGGRSRIHVSESAFVTNQAGPGGVIAAVATQGGAQQVEVVNSTFFGNQDQWSAAGTIDLQAIDGANLEAQLQHVTMTGQITGSAIRTRTQGTGNSLDLDLGNSILWNPGNSSSEVSVLGGQVAIDHAIVRTGCPSGAACTGIMQADPLLGPLGYHASPTLVTVPAEGSPAIDTAATLLCPPIDQRGFARPQGTGCDLGAVEVGQETIFANGFE